jgi:6-phosphogluconate dehydrogenase
MGMAMVQRLLAQGHEVTAYDLSPTRTEEASGRGALAASTIQELAARLPPPRVVWLMIPSGPPVQEMIDLLSRILSPGDILIDGGNSHYKDTLRQAEALAVRGLHLLDVGTSGGVRGHEEGYCLMIGGEERLYRHLIPVWDSLAPANGHAYVGTNGAGHFVKMVHNGIEYALLQAYGEGFSLLNASRFNLDLGEIARVWNRGSVIRSWLLELAERALERDPKLRGVRGYVEDTGEGRWTVLESVEQGVAAPTIAISLMSRFLSREEDGYSNRLIAALRREFGGHAVRESGDQG